MSRQVDLTKKLSAEDRDYLMAWGRYVDVQRNDAQFAGEGSKAAEGDSGPEKADTSGSDTASVPNGPALPERPLDYESMKVEDLKAELDKRKAAYEEAGDEDGATDVTYSSSDKKADLVFMLTEDDAAVSEDEEDAETS
jgi:hypothetical protein